MANKDFYDEDEIIDSIVNDTPNKTEESGRNDHPKVSQSPNMYVNQVGCGCLDVRKFMINFGIYSLVLMATAGLFPGFYLSGISAAFRAAFTLTFLNTFVKPLIIFFTFPITVMTLGFFYFIINGILLTMTAGIMGPDFLISNFFTATFVAIFISILQQFIKNYVFKVGQF